MVGNSSSNLGASVVPDLMRVYESLTQSKTPQGQSRDAPSKLSSSCQEEPSQNGQYEATAGPISIEQQPSHHQLDPTFQAATPAPANKNAPPALPAPSPVTSLEPTAKQAARPRRTTSRKRPAEPEKNGSNANSKPRRKKQGDGRWSKRFAWPDELHRDFVSAVFDVGLKHSSPSAILEQMAPNEQITTERIKSHLQKYRLHRQKSKKEFMSSYDSTLSKMKSGESEFDTTSMNCGEKAAHLTYSTMNEKEVVDSTSLMEGGVLQLPQLTEDEKHSPVGASMGYLLGLFFSLKQQLHAQRASQGISIDGPAIIPSTSPQPSVVPQDQALSSASAPFSNSGAEAAQVQSTVSVDGSDPNFQYQGQHNPCTPAMSNVAGASATQNKSFQHFNPAQQLLSSLPNAQEAPSTSSPAPAPPILPPDARNNNPMEESYMMKRDMQSQMTFQNKMRKLKEQELSKYTIPRTDVTSDGMDSSKPSSVAPKQEAHLQSTVTTSTDGAAKSGGEAIGLVDVDFWKSDEILDDQLFEFLMND